MLESLHIEHIATIKTLDVDFSSGFTVLTGETGAGKSIMIDSIALLLGTKSDRELIRSGETYATVSASFSALPHLLKEKLTEMGLSEEEGADSVILQRTITVEGRSAIRVSGKPVTLAMLREISAMLLTIHGQTDNQLLLKKGTHLKLLDDFADNDLFLERYREDYGKLRKLDAELASLNRGEAEKNRLREILQYQIQDIAAGKLKAGEEEALREERNQLQYAEKIAKNTAFCYRALKGSEKANTLLLIEKAMASIGSISDIIPEAGELAERLGSCKVELDDIAESIRELNRFDSEDPTERLNRVESRLDVIEKLERKYGETVAQVLAFRENAQKKLDELEHTEDRVEELNQERNLLLEAANLSAERLSERRKASAAVLTEAVLKVLSFLDMPKVQFCVSVEDAGNLSPTGRDAVEFLISTNPGSPLAPLSKIASGGELSRIMLALRSVLSEKDGIGMQIFDEVDTGISGKTAQKVGMKLKEIARNGQVLCITHSAQIAALADTHFRILKREVDGKNETSLELLDDSAGENGRIAEVSRILGGIEITETQRKTAKEMIENGKKIRIP